jgi:small subunit ribosomal protein S1
VVGYVPYGVQLELESGYRCVVHLYDLSWTAKRPDPNSVLGIGQEVEVVILRYVDGSREIRGSYRATLPDPWDEVATLFPVGNQFPARVSSVTQFGVFLTLPNGCTGLAHKSSSCGDLSLSVGDECEVQVLEFERGRKRLALAVTNVGGRAEPGAAADRGGM